MSKSHLFQVSLSMLGGALGAALILLVSHCLFPVPRIATINLTGMIDRFIQTESSKHLPQDVMQQDIKTFGMQLEKTLHQAALQQHLILLPSEAVIAGAPDVSL